MPLGGHADGGFGDIYPKGLTLLAGPLHSGLDAAQVHPLATTGIQDGHLRCKQAVSDTSQVHL